MVRQCTLVRCKRPQAVQARVLPEKVNAIGAGTGWQHHALCRRTTIALTLNIWCSRPTHHCRVVFQTLCALRAVKERLDSWPYLSNLLVQSH